MKGVVLAAGEGSRIQSVTYGAFPKELLPIGNVPTIRFPLETLRRGQIQNFLIIIAAQTKHGIIDGFRAGRKFGVEINYAVQEMGEGINSGLGAAVLAAKSWVGNDEFVAACGDSIIGDFSSDHPFDCLKPLIAVHKQVDSIATILVHPVHYDPKRFGVVKFKSYQENGETMFGEIEKMVEKPDSETAKKLRANGFHYVVTGYYVFKPSIFSYIEKTKPGIKNEIQLTDAMELAIESGEKITAVVHGRSKNGNIFPCQYWDVGVPEDYKNANKYLLEKDLDKWLTLECNTQ